VRVLVLDPSALLRGRLVRLIAALPRADVVVASGRDDWSRQLPQLDPDLVILEVRGSRNARLQTTLDKIRRIRRRHGRPNVVVLTNSVSVQHRLQCLQAGADFFLDKSFEFERVSSLLRPPRARRAQ
jgi:DNA-binding NarL/FixJ family response regulator